MYKISDDSICGGLGVRHQNQTMNIRLCALIELRIFAICTHMVLLRRRRYRISTVAADLVEKNMFEEVGDVGLVTKGDRRVFSEHIKEIQAKISDYSDWAYIRKIVATRYWEYSKLLEKPLSKGQSDVLGLAIQQACRHCGELVFGDIPGMDFVLFASGMFVESINKFEYALASSIVSQKHM